MRESQRILKFRAWVPKHKKFYLWGIGDIEGNESLFTGPPADPTAIHQQFSGLCDQNGKEIYEGDVVRWSSDPSSCLLVDKEMGGKLGVVRYCQYNAQFCFYFQGEVYHNFTGHTLAYCDRCEVIANIHESPELLEGA